MRKNNSPLGRHPVALLAALLVTLSGLALQPAEEAAAVTLPTDPPTVSAESLPTWQLDGVVWSTVVVGNTAYATGEFSKARPPGAALGSPLSVDAKNIFAFDVRTGNPVPFPHSLNGQGLIIRANDAGTRLYVGGDFTAVNNVARGHIAAFDLTQAGAPLTAFNARTDGQVRAFATIDAKVYAGGNFRSSNGKPRKLLAAYAAETGELLPWSPDGGDTGYVWTMVAAPDKSRVIAGGSFTTLNGISAYGMGSLDAASGATLPWAANTRLRTAGSYGAINGLSTDGTSIFGAGYAFGSGATFEGTFAANPTTGAIESTNDCLGDTYDTFPMSGVLYTVGHEHDCSQVDSYPDTNPRNRWQNANAERIGNPIGTYKAPDAYGWDFTGLPYTGVLQWFPTIAFGNYTSAGQGAWTVAGNGDYLVLGGEFPRVNGQAQQALTRFPKRGLGPTAKPVIAGSATPTPTPIGDGKVRVVFNAMYDRDDSTLTYDVYRTNSATRVATITRQGATFWQTPTLTFTDAGLAAGTQVRYQIRGRDADGNAQWSAWSGYVTVTATPPSAFAAGVAALGATHHWRLGEASGSTQLIDSIGDAHATYSGATLAVSGALVSEPNPAVTLSGTGQILTSTEDSAGPATTVEAWVKTSSSRGGRIIGMGSQAAGTSASTNLVLYLDNSGRPNFTVTDTARRTVTARNAIRDNQWHHVVAVTGADGVQLFVDGIRVARDQRIQPSQFTGFWRMGADSTAGFVNQPSDRGLAGSLDEVAVYPRALTLAEIQARYTASGRTGAWGTRASDGYGTAVLGDAPDLYWRLGEQTGSVLDSSGSGNLGTATSSVARRQTGPVAGSYAATFNGSNGAVVAQQGWASPGPFSAEVWFKTSTTRGGKLIGFGSATSGISPSNDRHVWMLNDGKLAFGTYTGVEQIVTSPQSYNDNQWHHVVATQGASGMRLYVDGIQVGANALAGAEPYLGYWRIGGDQVWGGATSNYFSGQLAEAAVYPSALGADAVLAHFVAAGRPAPNRPPVASFTTSKSFLGIAVDGSASSDPDGPLASYSWNFGDGATAAGATAAHTYAAPGTYQVTLTVADAQGLTATSTAPVTVAANVAPVASFGATVSHHSVAFDAAASSDPDGQIDHYAWSFGDGATGTGKTVTHDYGVAGTFTATLTVTDDQGGTNTTTTSVVTVDPPNVEPTAAFEAVPDQLHVAFDASASSDPDGSIAAYAWDFGDGATGTGVTPAHTYAAAGTYQVSLTVTDNRGGVKALTKPVTVAEAPIAVAADAFERSQTGAWGTADVGGPWTIVNGAVRFSVAGGKGKMTLATAGSSVMARLDSVSLSDADLSLDLSIDKAATGNGNYVSVVGRSVPGVGFYSAKLRVLESGAVQVILLRTMGTTETAITSQVLPGVTYTAGSTLRVRLQVVGTGSTALRLKVWGTGAEPTAWNLTATDSTAALQVAGGVGLGSYLSGSSTNAPVAFAVDNLTVVHA